MLLSLLVACGSDYAVKNICVESADGFDVEAVSTLQDAAGYPGARDAVVLDVDAGSLPEGASWRVTRVDLLAMVPEWVFDRYEGGDSLRVDVWDADCPRGTGRMARVPRPRAVGARRGADDPATGRLLGHPA